MLCYSAPAVRFHYVCGLFSLCDFIVSLKILMRSNFLFLWLQIKWDKMYSYSSLTQSHVLQQDEHSEAMFNSPCLLWAFSLHCKSPASKQYSGISDGPQHTTLKEKGVGWSRGGKESTSAWQFPRSQARDNEHGTFIVSELQCTNKRGCRWELCACSFYHVRTANYSEQEIQLDHSKAVKVFARLLHF